MDSKKENLDNLAKNKELKEKKNIIIPLLVLCWAVLFKSLIEMGMYIEYIRNRGNQICNTSDEKCFKARMTDSNYALNLKNVIMSVVFLSISSYCVVMVMHNINLKFPKNFNFLKKK